MRREINAAIERGGRPTSHVVQPAIDAARIIGEEDHLAHVVGKLHQIEVIHRPQQRMHKVFRRLLLHEQVLMDTATGVNGKNDLQRQLRLALKHSDLLRMVIFRKQELILGQARDRSAFVIGHIDEHIHQADIDADGRRLCGRLRVDSEAEGAAKGCAK